jgi:nicotinamidase-related amidase
MPLDVAIPDFKFLKAADFAGMIDPARTAVFAIDFQRDFCATDGFSAKVGSDMSTMEPAIDAALDVIQAGRKAGLKLVFMRVITREETDPAVLKRLMDRRGRSGGQGLCRAGTPGADYYRVKPEPGDIEIEKIRFDSFIETDLDEQLRANGIDTLIVTGVSTDCCVDSTTRSAFQRDYDVFVVADACAAGTPHLHNGALSALEKNVALLVTSDVAVEALESLA